MDHLTLLLHLLAPLLTLNQDFNILFPPMESQGKVDIFPPDLEETPWQALHTTLHSPHLIKSLNIIFIGSAFVHLCDLATTEVHVALKPVYTFQHCWCLSRCALLLGDTLELSERDVFIVESRCLQKRRGLSVSANWQMAGGSNSKKFDV